ncbi:TBC1 domain family member 2A-like [Perca fluviatilis]|uniref:TBC1 domain family member 2A-like n=1 Tax=Perca fluviatilis TaxID=8168 RepID=UPI0019631E64|nr:TBC1 domain family member 2A-like [Perca fluviatilis]
MDGSSLTGNPSAASSRRLPAHADTLQPADWISASEEEDARQKQQSPSERQQSPSERQQSPSEPKRTAERHQSPAERHQSPAERQQSPAERQKSPSDRQQSPSERQQSPSEPKRTAERHQSPAERQQSPSELKRTAEKHQSPAEPKRTGEKQQSPAEKQQSPAEPKRTAERQQSPAERQQSPSEPKRTGEKQQSPAEKQQSPAEPKRTAERQQSPAERQQSPTERQQNPTEPKRTVETPDHQGPTGPTNPEDSPTEPDPLKLNLVPTEQQQQLGDSLRTEKQKTKDPPKDQPEPDQTSPLKPDPRSPDQTSPLEPDPLSPDQKKPGVPEHEQKPDYSLVSPRKVTRRNTDLCFTDQKTEEDLPPLPPFNPSALNNQPQKHLTINLSALNNQPQKHLTINPSPLDTQQQKDLKLHISESKDQQNQQDPVPEKLTSSTAERLQDSLLNTEAAAQSAPSEGLTPALLVQAPPVQAPQVQDPLVQAPPVKDPPVQAPQVQAQQVQAPPIKDPQVKAPQVQAPPIKDPPVQAPQVKAPQVKAPQVKDPQVKDPPVKAPPVKAPPVQDPPVQAPPVKALQVQAPPPTLDPPPTLEVFCDHNRPGPLLSTRGEPKLCGFLQKQGGPLRAWKQRWFTYEEKKNQLFYYRTPQDVTPLGCVQLCSATFTYPLQAETGTFHIKTPERTFILKAVTQELMLYWLQQLQVKRWQHQQTSVCLDPAHNNNNNNNNNYADDFLFPVCAEDFLPALEGPLGLVGEGAANAPSQRTPLADMSLKHPLIHIQNSVHSFRRRSSQVCSQSVFHVDAPPWIPPKYYSVPPSPRTPSEPPVPPPALSLAEPRAPPPAVSLAEPLAPPPALSLAEPVGLSSPADGRKSPSLLDSLSRRTKTLSSSMTGSDRTSRLQTEKHMLVEEVKAQKELVWILHKALEASQLEKRTCAEFLAADGEQERLELLRHCERQAADLRGQLDAARKSLAQRDAQLAELQENIRSLTEKNNAKQQVIIKLSDQLTSCMSSGAAGLDSQTFRQLQQEIENLKDDIEAYKTQNKFLNSEIFQLTRLWRTSSEQQKSLMVKCSYLEASNCQVESRYLGVLRQLQEIKPLDPAQRGAVQKLIEDALKGQLKSVVKLNMARDHDEYGFKIVPDYEVEDMKLLAKIQALEIRSHNLLHQQEGGERNLSARWARFLAGRPENELGPSPELKALLRGGVPPEYRQRVWRWLVWARTRTARDRHPQRYQQLCEKSRTSPHPASRQIQLDLHRTLTTNQHFSSPSSPALQQLRRILLAFSWQNPAIGYCQGLNRLC